MKQVKILTDSCADLLGDFRKQYGIDYVRMNTVYKDKTTPASLDWEYFPPKELYDIMRGGERVLTTQVPAPEFERVFTEYLEQGMDIVYIGCSTKQSGSVNTGAVVAGQLLAKYPDAKIFCIDSLNACMGEGLLAMEAARLAAEGQDAAAISEQILARRKNVIEFITVHTLDYLKRAGRVKASAAFFGNLLGVKPILISDVSGEQTPVKKVKGRQNSMNEIVAMLKEAIVDPEQQIIHIVHADCDPAELAYLEQLVRKEIPCRDVSVNYIGPIVGASIGPGAIGLFAMGKTVTYQAQ